MLISEDTQVLPPGKWEGVCRKFSDLLPHLVPIVLCLVVAILAIWCSSQVFKTEPVASPQVTAGSGYLPASPPPIPTPGFTPRA